MQNLDGRKVVLKIWNPYEDETGRRFPSATITGYVVAHIEHDDDEATIEIEVEGTSIALPADRRNRTR